MFKNSLENYECLALKKSLCTQQQLFKINFLNCIRL